MTDSIDLAAFEDRFSGYLARLGEIDVAALTSALRPRAVAAGDSLITQGASTDALLFIESGSLEVSVANASEAPHVVATLSAGDVVGEVGLLAPGPATATVLATTDGRVLALDGQGLDALWSSHPAAASSLVQGLCQVMAARIRSVEGDIDRLEEHEGGFLSQLLHRLLGRAA